MKTYKLTRFTIAKTGLILGTNSRGEVWVEFRVGGHLKHWAYIIQEMPAYMTEYDERLKRTKKPNMTSKNYRIQNL